MKNTFVRKLFALLIALSCGAIVAEVIKEGILKKVDHVSLIGEASSETRISFNFGTRDSLTGAFNIDGAVHTLILPGRARKIGFRNRSYLGNGLQLVIERPTTLVIKRLELYNAQADSWTVLEGQNLFDALGPGNVRIAANLVEGEVEIQALHHQGIVNLSIDLHQRNQPLRYGLALLVAALVYVLLLYGRKARIPAIADMFPEPQSRQMIELDGLRGLAALLVMLEHTWAPFAGAGATGVWIFFILSGYLLAQPFVREPVRAVTPGFLGPYLVRRIGRILPMYLFVIVVTFGLNNNTPLMIEHLLFLEAVGHFWTIPQELAFYLFLPLFMLTGYLAHRISPKLFFPAMLGICLLLLWQPLLVPIDMPGSYRPPYMGWFLLGVVLASMGPLLERIRLTLSHFTRHWVGIAGTVLLGLLLSASCYGLTSTLVMENVTLPVNFPRIFGVIAALVMLLVLIAPGSLLGYVLRLVPLRAIGIVGYSFYLLHPFVIRIITEFSEKFWSITLTGPKLFVIATVITWLISLFTYSQIERPFLTRARSGA